MFVLIEESAYDSHLGMFIDGTSFYNFILSGFIDGHQYYEFMDYLKHAGNEYDNHDVWILLFLANILNM